MGLGGYCTLGADTSTLELTTLAVLSAPRATEAVVKNVRKSPLLTAVVRAEVSELYSTLGSVMLLPLVAMYTVMGITISVLATTLYVTL